MRNDEFKTYEAIAVEASKDGYPFEFQVTIGEQPVAIVRIRANTQIDALRDVSNSLRIEPAEKMLPFIDLNRPR